MPQPTPVTRQSGSQRQETVEIARAFANGCAALTGVEAIADAVPSFRTPPYAARNVLKSPWVVC